MTAEQEAKQLDSVTDMVQENESMDVSKANAAMTALSSDKTTNNNNNADHLTSSSQNLDQIVISKEHVDLIVSELEISEDIAASTLRKVINEQGTMNGDEALAAAFRTIIRS